MKAKTIKQRFAEAIEHREHEHPGHELVIEEAPVEDVVLETPVERCACTHTDKMNGYCKHQ